jgi:hypothetical protein
VVVPVRWTERNGPLLITRLVVALVTNVNNAVLSFWGVPVKIVASPRRFDMYPYWGGCPDTITVASASSALLTLAI